jgi:site-specific DNA-methyltransferase (adenine-specific)
MTTPSPRNQTLRLSEADRQRLERVLDASSAGEAGRAFEGVVCGDSRKWSTWIPPGSVDLLFLDPPYNLTREFGATTFRKKSIGLYSEWLDAMVQRWLPVLTTHSTVYICGDWRTSHSIFEVASRYLFVRNRITWEREKGRGALRNWKNNSEDIWFCTVGSEYTFNVDEVKSRRPVIAPYRNADGQPRDWDESEQGNTRDTHPSNLWTDISIPFWSMPENTDHPTQKSEKLLARLILASSRPGDMVLDPFAGSGTTCVVAKKLRRRFLGIEQEREFALLALKRLELAEKNPAIQGYHDGVFWPRNVRRAVKQG